MTFSSSQVIVFNHILDSYGVLPRRWLSDRTFFERRVNFEVYVVMYLNLYFIMLLNGKYRDLISRYIYFILANFLATHFSVTIQC
jgi:hypothetical protein